MSPTPSDCTYCDWDRQFPGFEAGGWIQRDNNGPIVACPVCNPNGERDRAWEQAEAQRDFQRRVKA